MNKSYSFSIGNMDKRLVFFRCPDLCMHAWSCIDTDFYWGSSEAHTKLHTLQHAHMEEGQGWNPMLTII